MVSECPLSLGNVPERVVKVQWFMHVWGNMLLAYINLPVAWWTFGDHFRIVITPILQYKSGLRTAHKWWEGRQLDIIFFWFSTTMKTMLSWPQKNRMFRPVHFHRGLQIIPPFLIIPCVWGRNSSCFWFGSPKLSIASCFPSQMTLIMILWGLGGQKLNANHSSAHNQRKSGFYFIFCLFLSLLTAKTSRSFQ